MSLTKTPPSMIATTGATAGQVLTYNASTTTWVASAAPGAGGAVLAVNAAKAWVLFDATRNSSGGVDALATNRFIRSSYNVSSVMRNSAGNFTINFTNAMTNAEYCCSIGSSIAGVHPMIAQMIGTQTTNSIDIRMQYGSDVQYRDADKVSAVIFGN